MRLADFQRQFQAAILDPAAPGKLALGLRIPGRVRVHHSHFWTRMTEFIANWQPLLAKYLPAQGLDLDPVVRRYIAAHPPQTVVAWGVAAQLADFLRTTEPWSAWPILGELAEIDYRRALIRAAAEEATVTRAQLDAIDPAAIAAIRFRLKQRSAVLGSRFRLEVARLHLLTRDTPLDAHPAYRLIHMTGRQYATIELDERSVRAFEPLAEGLTLSALDDHLASLGYDARERRRFVDHVLGSDLLVAIPP
jgi:hypothetical protein